MKCGTTSPIWKAISCLSIPKAWIWYISRAGAIADTEEVDYVTFVFQAQFELRSGCADVALEYLDAALTLDPEDEILFVIRSKCLNR